MHSLLYDAFAHHIWATQRLIDACRGLTREQLVTHAPGTYGPIIATFGHMVSSDAWYLSFFGDVPAPMGEDHDVTLDQLRATITANGAAWLALLEGDIDPDADMVEHGDGWDFHAATGVRLTQVVQHGNDHRSQICTALTSLGIEPPEIDVWAYAEATGRARGEELGAGS